MSKYRIVQVAPEWSTNRPFVIQVLYPGESWKEIMSLVIVSSYPTFKEADDAVSKLLEYDKWNATHGKYQVLKEYE